MALPRGLRRGDPASWGIFDARTANTPHPGPPVGDTVDVDEPYDGHESHDWTVRDGERWLECCRCFMRDYYPGASETCKVHPQTAQKRREST